MPRAVFRYLPFWRSRRSSSEMVIFDFVAWVPKIWIMRVVGFRNCPTF